MASLARKLRELVHLASTERRAGEAQRQVRRAEVGAAPPPEAAGPMVGGGANLSGAAEPTPAELDAIKQEVVDTVLRELESLAARREEPDGRGRWW
jgi:hypothetical protein